MCAASLALVMGIAGQPVARFAEAAGPGVLGPVSGLHPRALAMAAIELEPVRIEPGEQPLGDLADLRDHTPAERPRLDLGELTRLAEAGSLSPT
jgi:hypothetical protein